MFSQGKYILISSLSIEDFFPLFLLMNFRTLHARKKDLILFSFTHLHLAELVVNSL